jgi:hypothetical protein
MLLHKMKEHMLYEIRNLTLYVQEKSLPLEKNTVPRRKVRQVSLYKSFVHIVAIMC